MHSNSGLRTRRARLLTLPLVGLVVLLGAGSLGTAIAAPQAYYLTSTGVPISFLSETYPTATDLANFAPARDDEPGLLLHKSSNEHNETDPDKYQLWMTAPGGIVLDGPAEFTFWSAMKDFAPDKGGSVRLQLFDCDIFLADCRPITGKILSADPWSGGATDWVQHTISYNNLDYIIPESRSLAAKLVVRSSADDDMLFAYDTAAFPSSLTVTMGATAPPTTTSPPATTTTLPPTTTTTAPPTTTTFAPPTTTTFAPPATTTSLPPETTTTLPPVATTTTTVPEPIPATTTTLPEATTSTTTTTAVPATPTTIPNQPGQSVTTTTLLAADPAEPTTSADQQEDAALAALAAPDDTDPGGSRPGGAFSNALLDGLTLVVPPAVAAALLSPLVLLEALLAVFASTGKELLVPLATLTAGVIWVGGRRRRQEVLAPSDSGRAVRYE